MKFCVSKTYALNSTVPNCAGLDRPRNHRHLFWPLYGFAVLQKVPTVTEIGLVLVAIPATAIACSTSCCYRVLKVLTVTGIGEVLILYKPYINNDPLHNIKNEPLYNFSKPSVNQLQTFYKHKRSFAYRPYSACQTHNSNYMTQTTGGQGRRGSKF